MHQALGNLLTNAEEAMPTGGEIRITLDRAGDEVRLAFADTGCGIKPEHLSLVFEPFFTTKGLLAGGDHANPGLGLSVVHGIVLEMGAADRRAVQARSRGHVHDVFSGPRTQAAGALMTQADVAPAPPPQSRTGRLVQVRGLKTYFPVRGGWLGRKRYVRAVDGVDLSIARGRTLGLVGESGSGKTTVGRTLLRLIEPTAGSVLFDGHDVLSMPPAQLRHLRRKMQIIFQDPVGSLNPRMTVGDIVAEPLVVHNLVPRRQRSAAAGELMGRVGLSSSYVNRYPHEFSGGQRQRIGIARALAAQPEFIVCDEPVSALDVSIQAQILNLLRDLQNEMGLTYLFIAHNLAVVEHFADEVAVMYLGRIVEQAPSETLYANPIHPYTRALLAAVPVPDPTRKSTGGKLPGETPSPISPPPGCHFHPRCPLTRSAARELSPDRRAAIECDGQSVEVCRECVEIDPVLTAVPGGADHVHACTLRMTATR